MIHDPIVDEVREIRRRILEECGNDLKRVIERLKAAEAQDQSRMVTLDEVQSKANAPNTAI